MKIAMRLALGAVVFYCACHGKAYALSVDTFGTDPMSVALGDSLVAGKESPFMAKDNPAALILLDRPSFSLSYMEVDYHLQDANSTRDIAPQSGLVIDTYKASKARSTPNASFALSMPLQRENPRFFLGIAAFTPLDSMARVHAFSGNESHYLRFNDRQSVPSLFLSMGTKISSRFSLGAGLYYSVKAQGGTQVALSETMADAQMLMELRPELLPFLGARYDWKLSDDTNLVFGAFYRQAQKSVTQFRFDVAINLDVASVPFGAQSELAAFYDPEIYRLGAGLIKPAYELFLAVEKTMWSHYKAPILILQGKDLETLTGGRIKANKIAMEDTYGIHLGYEYKKLPEFFSKKFVLRSSYAYYESALKRNPDDITVLDTNRHVVAAGLGMQLSGALKINLALQNTILEKRDYHAIDSEGANRSAHIGGHILTYSGGIDVAY